MKAGFSFTKRFVPAWNDNQKLNAAEQFVAVLGMLTSSDLFAILERMSALEMKDGEKITTAQAASLVKEAGTYVSKYVKLENAEDFTVENVVELAPFFPLAVELLFALVKFAQPGEDDTKN